jgi:hypothetical protein
MQYQVNISIDNAGLQAIYAAGQAVTFVKSVVANPLSSGNLPIAWIAFQPFQVNQVSWVENYKLYGTTTQLQAGAQIVMTSMTTQQAQLGWLYTFQNGMFNAQSGLGNTFNLSNQANTPTLMNFGLSQIANVNGVSVNAPLNSIPVLYNQLATFTPQEQVSVFLSSYEDNGVVISQVASNALNITLSSQNPTASVGFNDATNTFYLQSSLASAKEDRPRIGLEFARKVIAA